jgi:hypothetical protein
LSRECWLPWRRYGLATSRPGTPGFDDGWEAGRCYDWKEMNQMAKYYGFDRSKIADTERESFERSCDIVAKWSNESFLTKLFE